MSLIDNSIAVCDTSKLKDSRGLCVDRSHATVLERKHEAGYSQWSSKELWAVRPGGDDGHEAARSAAERECKQRRRELAGGGGERGDGRKQVQVHSRYICTL